jgi:hypothetical protein
MMNSMKNIADNAIPMAEDMLTRRSAGTFTSNALLTDFLKSSNSEALPAMVIPSKHPAAFKKKLPEQFFVIPDVLNGG